jgi:hypothetical protein
MWDVLITCPAPGKNLLSMRCRKSMWWVMSILYSELTLSLVRNLTSHSPPSRPDHCKVIHSPPPPPVVRSRCGPQIWAASFRMLRSQSFSSIKFSGLSVLSTCCLRRRQQAHLRPACLTWILRHGSCCPGTATATATALELIKLVITTAPETWKPCLSMPKFIGDLGLIVEDGHTSLSYGDP